MIKIMKQISYYPRKLASESLGFATPDRQIRLSNSPSIIDDSDHEWLLENDEEYKLCIDNKIIFVEDIKPPESNQLKLSNPGVGIEDEKLSAIPKKSTKNLL